MNEDKKFDHLILLK